MKTIAKMFKRDNFEAILGSYERNIITQIIQALYSASINYLAFLNSNTQYGYEKTYKGYQKIYQCRSYQELMFKGSIGPVMII